MKIGYVTSGFTNHNINDVIRILNKLGYNGMELVLDKQHYHPYYSSSIEDIKKIIKENGMEVVVGTGGRFALTEIKHEPTFVNPDENGRRDRIEFTKKAIDTCVKLEGSVVTGHSGKLQDNISPVKAQQWLIEGLSEVYEYANDLGITFALEPEPGMFIQSLNDWFAVNKQINVGFCLDIGHVFCTEDEPIAVVKNCAKLADNIHLEDIKDKVHKHLMLGEGDINFGKILPLISNVDCMVNVELHDHSNVAETTAKESIAKIRSILSD